MLLLILRDLQYRRWRVGLTIVLMAIVMTLLFLMSGLVEQFNSEPYIATERAGGELNWVVADGTGGPFTSPKPVDAFNFDAVDGEPILVAQSSLDGLRVSVIGRAFDDMSEPPVIEGRYPEREGEILVDATTAMAVGEQTNLGGLPGTVVGITQDATVLAGVPLVFVSLEFSQEVAVGGRNMILAKLTDETPAPPQGLKLMTPAMIGDDALLPLDGAIASVTLVQSLLWLITVIIIAAIIYITALERTRDFAVLKAVGGRTSNLGLSLLVQGVLMTLIAVGLAGFLQSLIAPSFPMTVRVPSTAWITIAVGAAVAAIAAGAAGVLRVKATSPAEAFG